MTKLRDAILCKDGAGIRCDFWIGVFFFLLLFVFLIHCYYSKRELENKAKVRGGQYKRSTFSLTAMAMTFIQSQQSRRYDGLPASAVGT